MGITRADAVEIARKACEKRGIPWREPVSVAWGIFSFVVRTNAMCRGANAIINVKRGDGRVVSAHYIPY